MPRPSKLKVANLVDYVNNLRENGYSYSAICDDVNSKWHDIALTNNDLSRHFLKKTKATICDTDIFTTDSLSILKIRILNEMDRCSLSSGDKKSLRRVIESVWKALSMKEKDKQVITEDVEREVNKQMSVYLTQIADKTSYSCKCEIRDVLMDIYGISGSYKLYKEKYPQIPSEHL